MRNPKPHTKPAAAEARVQVWAVAQHVPGAGMGSTTNTQRQSSNHKLTCRSGLL